MIWYLVFRAEKLHPNYTLTKKLTYLKLKIEKTYHHKYGDVQCFSARGDSNENYNIIVLYLETLRLSFSGFWRGWGWSQASNHNELEETKEARDLECSYSIDTSYNMTQQ